MRICPRCQHVNPDEAAFCYFDGLALRTDAPPIATGIPLAQPVDAGPLRLPNEFFFPSGQRCSTFDDLVKGALDDWPTARELLTSGAFRHYLTAAGRLDLARAATEAVQQHQDADAALDAFLARLPATHPPKPELELVPHKLILGALAVGESRQAQLVVQNIGSGLLHGSLNLVEGGTWLRLADHEGTTVRLKVAREQTVRFAVTAQGVPAPMKCAARLTIITNGGVVEVPVRLDVTPQAFPHAPYLGALNPRDLAVLIRGNPKPAIPMFESGLIPRWFESNSWGYPVIGATAPGMAAVQQFFEALGLAKAPRIQLEETTAHFTASGSELISGRAALVTADRKWIYAQARCEAPWVRITTPAVSGPQHAGIDFELATQHLAPGRAHAATVEIIANGAQRLALAVNVEVQKHPEPVRPRVRRPIVLVGVFALLLRVIVAGPADIYAARVLTAGPGEPGGSFGSWREAPASAEFVRHFVLATGWLGAVIAVLLLLRRGRLLDLPYALIAGAAAGVAASGSLACLLPLLDWPARALWRHLPAVGPLAGESFWPATAAWVVLAAVCWAVLAAAVAFLVPRRS